MRIGFMAARSVGLRAYLYVRVEGCSSGSRIEFSAQSGGKAVPLEAFGVDAVHGDNACGFAVAFPVRALSAANVTLYAIDENLPGDANGSSAFADLTRVRFDVLRAISKVFAKGHERVLGEVAAKSSAMQGAYELYQMGCFDFGDETVWRIAVEWIGDSASSPRLDMLDASLLSVPFAFTVFESQDGMDAYWMKGRKCRRVYSLRLNAEVKDFCLVASDPSGSVGDGLYLMDAPAADALLRESFDVLKSVTDEEDAYPSWLESHRAAIAKASAQRSLEDMPASFTVVVQGEGGDELLVLQSIESLARQLVDNCEIVVSCPADCSAYDDLASGGISVVKNDSLPLPLDLCMLGKSKGTGSYVCVIRPGDVFEEHAFEVLAMLAVDSGADVLYCDEDYVDREGVFGKPSLKTAFNRDLFYASNWTGRAVLFSRKLIETMPECDATTLDLANYASCLEAIRRDAAFEHVPFVLLHKYCESLDSARSGARGFEAADLANAKEMLTSHFAKMGQPLGAVEAPLPGMLNVEAKRLPEGKVSVVIPTKDHVDTLRCCVDSVMEKAGGIDYEIVLVENNSTRQETFDYYEEIKHTLGENVKVVVWDGPFNYSEIINYGVAHSRGEFLLLLNNDTKAISDDFLDCMLMHMWRKEVGVVGAKLLFADGLVQHCGMIIGPYGGIAHVNQNYPLEKGGYDGRACVVSEYSSVTGACQMMRREVFDEVGGYDPLFAVGFNDADFCLRVREHGYDVICESGALLHHYEFVSRGRDEVDVGKKARWKKEQKDFMARWPEVFECGDPFMTPNFDPNSWYYALSSNHGDV